MKRAKRGFSILEVVWAFAILELGILAIIGVFPSISKLNNNAWNMTIAGYLTQEKMDELLSLEKPPIQQYSYDYPQELSGCSRIWWGEVVDMGNNNFYTIVRVEVRWSESGRTRSFTLTSMMSE